MTSIGSVLINSIGLANKAHDGQMDLSGDPYILHPMHIMHKMDSHVKKIIAILHDVTEDTEYTLDEVMCEITNGYSLLTVGNIEYETIKRALWLLDKNNHKNYSDMIEAIFDHTFACCIKIEDISHNMDLKRIIGKEDMSDKDMKRVRKYMKSLCVLTKV